MAAAAALLAARPWSVADLRARLTTLGYPAPLVGTVIERLVDFGYLDDARYAAAWVASRDRARPRGAAALRRELARKGIDQALIEAALETREVPPTDTGSGEPGATPDLAAAQRLLARRRHALAREPDPRKRRQKAYALLARNGFDPDVCASAVRALPDVDGDGQGDRPSDASADA